MLVSKGQAEKKNGIGERQIRKMRENQGDLGVISRVKSDENPINAICVSLAGMVLIKLSLNM